MIYIGIKTHSIEKNLIYPVKFDVKSTSTGNNSESDRESGSGSWVK